MKSREVIRDQYLLAFSQTTFSEIHQICYTIKTHAEALQKLCSSKKIVLSHGLRSLRRYLGAIAMRNDYPLDYFTLGAFSAKKHITTLQALMGEKYHQCHAYN